MHVLWFFPTGGSDGRYLATKIGQREATPGYLRQIATAIDELGYYGRFCLRGRAAWTPGYLPRRF